MANLFFKHVLNLPFNFILLCKINLRMNKEQIKSRLEKLAPWHFDIKVTSELSTTDVNKMLYDNSDKENVKVVDPNKMEPLLLQVFPEGLKGKKFLDAGCNGGGYCFLANRMGADYVFGFDIRDHWINQASFLQEVFKIPETKMNFKVQHIDDLQVDRAFDVTLFKGVLYHVPNPIGDIERLCKATNELIIIDTSSKVGAQPNTFTAIRESPTHVMSGVDGLAWLPSGPEVVERVLKWQGFPEMRVIWNRRKRKSNDAEGKKERGGRFRVIAARNKAILENFDRLAKEK